MEQQPEHHRTRTFSEEYLELLRRTALNSMSVAFNSAPLPDLGGLLPPPR